MERDLEASLRDEIKKRGGLAIKMNPLGFSGLPDRLILLPGAKIFFVETKGVEKQPRPRQLAVHRQLERLGFRIWCIWTREHLKILLNTIDA